MPSFGWSAGLPGSGTGAKSLGEELATSDMFAQCQVTKVFQAVCFRAPISTADQATVAAIKTTFKSRLQPQAGVPAVRCRLRGQLREYRHDQY